MRFVDLALSALSLAGLTNSEAVNNDAPLSFSYSAPVETSLSRWHPTDTLPTQPSLTRTHPPDITPTRSMHTTQLRRRQEISLTLPFTGICSDGYTTSEEIFQSSVCDTPPTNSVEPRPCAASWIATYFCKTTTTTRSMWTSNDLGGRSQRWVEKYAKATPATDLPTITGGPHSGLPGKPGHPSPGHPFSGKPSGGPILEPLRTKPAEVMPTITTIPAQYSAIRRREEMGPTTSLTGCSWGYTPVSSTFVDISCSSYWSGGFKGTRTCSSVGTWPTVGCTQTMCPSGFGPREPTATSDMQTCISTGMHTPTRTNRKVVKSAPRSTQDLGSRSQRAIAQFATRSTQNLGGRGQRYAARFAESTITSKPDVAAATTVPFPTCTFDVTKGEYICPEAAKTLPLCSFDVTKGEYICPTVAAATPTLPNRPYHVNARGREIPPPDRCAECFLAIEDCHRDCNDDDHDCKNACPCDMYMQIPSCGRCTDYKRMCGSKAGEAGTKMKTVKV